MFFLGGGEVWMFALDLLFPGLSASPCHVWVCIYIFGCRRVKKTSIDFI